MKKAILLFSIILLFSSLSSARTWNLISTITRSNGCVESLYVCERAFFTFTDCELNSTKVTIICPNGATPKSFAE